MGDEQTVLDAGLHEYGARRLIAALGLDPDMPLSRLREDLQIAARARAALDLEERTAALNAEYGCNRPGYNVKALLAFLRGDAQ